NALTLGGNVGSNLPLKNLTINSGGVSTSIGGNITTTGTQNYNVPILLTGSNTKTFTSGANIFMVNGLTVNGAAPLVLDSSGTTTLGGIIGGTTPLVSLITGGTGSVRIGNSITTTGVQTYNNPTSLIIGASTLTSSGSGSNGNITFGSTLNGAFGLTVNTAGTTSFGGII